MRVSAQQIKAMAENIVAHFVESDRQQAMRVAFRDCSAARVVLPLEKRIRAVVNAVGRAKGISAEASADLQEFRLADGAIVIRNDAREGWIAQIGGDSFPVEIKLLKPFLLRKLREMPVPATPVPAKPRKRRLRAPTADEVKEVRALARSIGKRYGAKLLVSKGRGSMGGTVSVQNGDYPVPDLPEMRIELVRELIKRGYESALIKYGPESSLKNHALALALSHGHGHVRLDLMKWE